MYCPAFQSPQWRRLATCAHAALADESGHFMDMMTRLTSRDAW